jgi:dTDP-4-amino-4,6-dideoxygalactose transaminase
MIGVGTFKITDKARRYVNDVLTSERLSYGYFTQKFERLFAAAHGCRFAIMTNSGTSSLQIALAALKIRHGWADGDEVIVPAVTFIATSNIVLQNNMRPVFVDVEPVFYELDPAKIEAAITPRTRAIIPVHLFGCPSDMGPIMEIAQRRGLRVIEDSCETMFAGLNGRSVGSFGDIGCFSTYVAHILTTGIGGLCTTNDPDLAVQLRSMMNHGRDSIYISIDDDKGKSKEEMEVIIQRRFSFVQMGYSYRVTELEGALGLAAFEDHEEMMKQRFANGTYFMEALKPLAAEIQLPTLRAGANHAFMMFPVVCHHEPKRELVNYLEQNGIETRDMLPLTNQPYYQKSLNLREEDFPVAKWINESGFYIASHQGLTDTERHYIVETFQNYFAHKQVRAARSCLVLMSRGDGRSARLIFDTIPVGTFDERIFVEGSGDREAAAFFEKGGARVLCEVKGKGALLRQAIELADAENIVVMGMDGADNPEDLSRLLIGLKSGSDLVVGSRFMPGGERATSRLFSYRSIGNRFFSFLLSVLFSRNITDCNNLFRGFKKSAIQGLGLKDGGESIMFEMTLRALDQGLKISEVPTTERTGFERRSRRNRLLSAFAFMGILLFRKRTKRKSP